MIGASVTGAFASSSAVAASCNVVPTSSVALSVESEIVVIGDDSTAYVLKLVGLPFTILVTVSTVLPSTGCQTAPIARCMRRSCCDVPVGNCPSEYLSRRCTTDANCSFAGSRSTAEPATSRVVVGVFVAGSMMIMTLDVSAPGGTISVAAPFSAVTVAPVAPTTAPSLTVTCVEAVMLSTVSVIDTAPVATPSTSPSADTVA